ncbi:MAG: hypothetical protein R3A79_25785 [Nannocystaceae bacterium]
MAANSDNDKDAPSTGFLPITLALTLFIAGLFILGAIPGFQCGAPSP